VQGLLRRGVHPHCLRDLTRGGLAAVLHEFARASGHTPRIEEEGIPLAPGVARSAELLGLEPLELACEGRFLAVLPPAALRAALEVLAPGGGRWIGSVAAGGGPGAAAYGPEQRAAANPLPSGELLPRIC